MLYNLLILSYLVALSLIGAGFNMNIEDSNDNKPVILVIVIARHGRTTSANYTYPLDPLQSLHQQIWPEGYETLTNKGKLDDYELGLYLRRRYDALLGDRYTSDSVYVLTTDKDQTMESAMCLLAALYPPKGDQIWNPDLLWQPLPVHAYDRNARNLLNIYDENVTACPRFWQEIERMQRSPHYVEFSEKYKDMRKYLEKKTGMDIYNIVEMKRLYEYVESQVYLNVTLAEWTREIFPEPWLSSSVIHYFVLPTSSPLTKRLFIGPLLKEILEEFEEKAGGKSGRKLTLLSGEGENLSNLLNVLGGFDWAVPPPSAAVIMELRADRHGNHFVSVKYRTREVRAVQVGGCEGPVCSLQQFRAHISPYLPTDWAAECSLDTSASASLLTQGLSALLLLFLLTIQYSNT